MFGFHPLRGSRQRIKKWLRARRVPIWYDPTFRLPISALESQIGIEPQRADFTAWYLVQSGRMASAEYWVPRRASMADLALVHTGEYLESLADPASIARMLNVDPSDIPLDEVMHTMRLAAGATVAAARTALEHGGQTLNLMGGFHRAAPGHGAGLSTINDVAIAIAALREEGFRGPICVLDLDAHPPDGLAACVEGDSGVWLGSISATAWRPLPGVDEVPLAPGTEDAGYLRALTGLLARMPYAELVFVIAGGDVLADDRRGRLALTLAGARRRDLLVLRTLEPVPSVWLPGGGYHRDAWRVLAGTAIALLEGSAAPIPADYDPLHHFYSGVFRSIKRGELGESAEVSASDIEESLGISASSERRLLGFYTRHGIEYALFRYGILGHIQRLGYGRFRVEIEPASAGGDLMRLIARDGDRRHVLIELVLERSEVAGRNALYIHWLALRNPKAEFSRARPRLPGQEVPGLGLAREVSEFLERMAARLGLDAVAFRPGHYHIAYAVRRRFRFVEPARQGRFEALIRDLAGVSLLDASVAVAAGNVRVNGEPYAWETDVMLAGLEAEQQAESIAVAAERARVHFTIQGSGSPSAGPPSGADRWPKAPPDRR